MANVTVTTNSANIPIGFDKDIIGAIQFETVLQPTVKHYAWNKSMGQTIVTNRGVNWEKSTKVPGTQLTPTSYSTTSEFLYIDTFEVSALLLEDFGKLFIPDNVLASEAQSMGYALARGVDTTIANLYQSFSASVSGTAYNVELTFANALAASRMLRVGGVKPGVDKTFLVISPQQTEAFKNMEVFTNSLYAGQAGIDNFKKATLAQSTTLGATIVESMLLRAPAGGGHDMAMYSMDAIGIAFAQEPQLVTDYIGLDTGELKVYKQAYGVKRSYRTVETPGSPALTDAWAALMKGV